MNREISLRPVFNKSNNKVGLGPHCSKKPVARFVSKQVVLGLENK
jgi:hypothetical protein